MCFVLLLKVRYSTPKTAISELDSTRAKSLQSRFDRDAVAATTKGTMNKTSNRVLLLAQFRTGSTFFGQMFNLNPDMFYLFEPLRVVGCLDQIGAELHDYENTTSKLVERVLRCEFSEQFASCFLNFPVGVYYTKNMTTILKKTSQSDEPLSPAQFLRSMCLSYHGDIAMKTIRAKMENIVGILQLDKYSDVKVLHLVRDPRGVANSRKLMALTAADKQAYKNFMNGQLGMKPNLATLISKGLFLTKDSSHSVANSKRETVNEYCRRLYNDIQFILHQPLTLRNRYKLIRYEDFAFDPEGITQKIYSFLGMNSPPETVVQWLRSNTNVSEKVSDNKNSMGLHKNSVTTAGKWRVSLSSEEVKQVQAVCADVMIMLGYKLFTKESHLLNLNITSIGAINLGLDIGI